MTPDSAYEWLAPKLSAPERAALDVIFNATKANPDPRPSGALLDHLQRKLCAAATRYAAASKNPRLDAQEAIALIEAAMEFALAADRQNPTKEAT